MRSLLVFIFILIASIVRSQELIFKMNQYAVSHKNNVGKFDDALVKNGEILITLQEKVVKLYDEKSSALVLHKMTEENNNNKHSYTQVWKGLDNTKTPVQFKFTVNLESKEAMVEVLYRNYKNYYFGKYNHGNLEEAETKNSQARAFR